MASEHTVPKFTSSPPPPGAVAKSITEPQSGTSRDRRSSRAEGEEAATKYRERGKDRDDKDRRRRRDSRERDSHRSRRHEGDHRDERRKHRHHRHHDEERNSTSAEKRALIKFEPKDTAPSRQDVDDSMYVLDKRGDPLISRYGTNERSKVPAYRRHGAGKLLGSQQRFTISRDGVREEFVVSTERERGSVFRERSTALLKAAKWKGHRIKPSLVQQNAFDGGGDGQEFISLSLSKREKPIAPDDSSAASEDDGPAYRSIHGKAKNHEFSDSDLDYDSDESAAALEDDPKKFRSIELSRHVKDQPSDTEAWLELVDLQDYLIGTEFGTQEHTTDETKGLADIKMSMLEKALSNAGPQHREPVLLQLMLVGSHIWAPEEIARRWQDIAEEHAQSFNLWKARMDFEMSNLSTFTVDRIKALYIERVKYLQEQIEAASVLPDIDIDSISSQLIYVFLRMTHFLQDSGFSELAVAAWQAVLELTFSRPPDLVQTRAAEIVKSSLGEFWESEVARIGEPRAKGWSHFTQASDTLDVPESTAAESHLPLQTRDSYKAWAATERHHMAKILPARTLDEDGNEDPFRVVMFSDIEELLFVLPLPVSSEVQQLLLDCFLLFCQVTPYSRECSWIQAARRDPFIVTGTLGILTASTPETTQKTEQDVSDTKPPFSHPTHHFAVTSDTSFSESSGFTSRPLTSRQHQSGVDDTLNTLATLATRFLVRNCRVEDLAGFSLLLDHVQDPKGVKKAAKALLKLYPSNVSLYNAYALAENANGNADVAEKVLGAAVSLDMGFESMVLWNTWAWMELERGQNDLAIQRLCSSLISKTEGQDVSVTPSQLLKTRQHLAATRDYRLSTGNRDIAAIYAQSYALLEYLTSGTSEGSTANRQGNLTPALDSIFSFSSELCSRGHSKSLTHELFLQFAARLIYFHASHGPYRPTTIRQHLHRLITLFPANTLFLHLFAYFESSLRLNDPVREILRTNVLTPSHDTLSSRVFAIQHELRVGNAYSIRSAFESALASPAGKGCTGLWRAYISFCHEKRELSMKSKDVFYRAVMACPWSKEVAMEAFGVLVREMDSGELRGVYATMQDMGLRVRVDLEGFVKRWREEQKAVGRKR